MAFDLMILPEFLRSKEMCTNHLSNLKSSDITMVAYSPSALFY